MASSFIFLLFMSVLVSSIVSIHVIVASPGNNITLTEFTKLQLPFNATSSGSLSFNSLGDGPYIGTSDGRILKYSRLFNSFKDFAYNSPNRTKAFCDGTIGYDRSPTCGFPTGLNFNDLTGHLYICDAYVGLTTVGILGGLATTLVRTTDGVPPYRFLIGVDVAIDGTVYFTDSSAIYGPKDLQTSIQTGDSTARLLKYDPKTRTVTTLLTQLARAIGVATNRDASFVLVSESSAQRIIRYWLKGEKAGTSEIFLTFPGRPNKIKRNQDGDFWIAVNIPKNDTTIAPQGVKISPCGEILSTVDLSKEYNRRISLVREQDGKIYIGATNITYIGQYKILHT